MRSIDIFLWVADYRDDKKGLDSQMVTKSDTCIGHLVYAVIERYRIIKAASNHGALIRCRLDKVKDWVFLRRLLNFR